jgi:hypothetical protein
MTIGIRCPIYPYLPEAHMLQGQPVEIKSAGLYSFFDVAEQ